jgi:hypothetical protein
MSKHDERAADAKEDGDEEAPRKMSALESLGAEIKGAVTSAVEYLPRGIITASLVVGSATAAGYFGGPGSFGMKAAEWFGVSDPSKALTRGLMMVGIGTLASSAMGGINERHKEEKMRDTIIALRKRGATPQEAKEIAKEMEHEGESQLGQLQKPSIPTDVALHTGAHGLTHFFHG